MLGLCLEAVLWKGLPRIMYQNLFIAFALADAGH